MTCLVSRRWEDGAAGGSRRGSGGRLAVRAAEGGSGDHELPVESPSAAEQGERSPACPVPGASPACPTIRASRSAAPVALLPLAALPQRVTPRCGHGWHWGTGAYW